MQLSETKRNAFTDIALGKLLDSNLSAKYALTGKLGECETPVDSGTTTSGAWGPMLARVLNGNVSVGVT